MGGSGGGQREHGQDNGGDPGLEADQDGEAAQQFDKADDGSPRLGGFFDFYFAGCDKWLFDLAVTVNDWCCDLSTGVLDEARVHAMLRAYETVRPLTDIEASHWRDMLRAAALRFWLSRLYDFHLPRAAEMLKPHDPGHFERILRQRIEAHSIPWR